ncbi:MAG: hypothetical protein CO017_02505, partial [Zetaproteobacteria bacterium CG_4_8_14_3_um_filter_59_5]
FCSSEEKPLLEAVEAFITKPVEVITVSKKGYSEVIREHDRSAMDLKALVAEHDAWMSKGSGKKKGKRR